MLHWRRKSDYALGCGQAGPKLRYQGVAEEIPALTSRKGTQSRTSIQSKQRDKYETNEISENIGSLSGLRGGGWYGAGARDHNRDDHNGPGDRYDDNRVGDDHERRHDYGLHARFGLYYVPIVDGYGPCEVLLHERHDHSGSGRAYRGMVGDSARDAGDGLLHECWRPSGCSQSRVEPASSGLREERNHNDNDQALIAKGRSFSRIKGARGRFSRAPFFCGRSL
jgi:hypothetical protein